MAAIVFRKLEYLKPTAPAEDVYEMDIIFEVLEPGLKQALNLQLLYICAKPGKCALPGFIPDEDDDGIEISKEDVLFDEVDCGPLEKVGRRRVRLEGGPVDFEKMEDNVKLDQAGLVLSCKYEDQEFYRVGWYVRHEYADPELNENRPNKPDMSKVIRIIDTNAPLETKIELNWQDIFINDARRFGSENDSSSNSGGALSTSSTIIPNSNTIGNGSVLGNGNLHHQQPSDEHGEANGGQHETKRRRVDGPLSGNASGEIMPLVE